MSDSITLAILASVREKLRQDLPSIEVDLFPDNPATYRFIHAVGAVLIGYQGSDYEMMDDTHAIVQTRKLTFSLTVFGRGVHHDKGAIALLDKVERSSQAFALSIAIKFIWSANAICTKTVGRGNMS